MAGAIVPEISQNDLAAFHDIHFSPTGVNHFTEHFLGPVEEGFAEEAEADELGYYEDGVKRTLTDEQISIFRHSEIQALLRDRRHAEESKAYDHDEEKLHKYPVEEGELEELNIMTETVTTLPSRDDRQSKKAKKGKKAQQPNQKRFFKQNIKPDLRKRTWDNVDSAVQSLDYDGEESGTVSNSRGGPQRRKISYDD